ncbi:hypothetical protein BN12_550012 [Nostocoides japonicum T1-X7]|uniref:Uncharacterized protein n=1 Tax=Nostocoides japonicum T1-X7 TaxID=1194083 RepID=A0A077M6F2_9MICO|nr:hypothetical protein [Tetrasphaera japonica]CCH79729.1 hypothetical protein BN12_550012 [Tetrasphaera japonica T1-X7]
MSTTPEQRLVLIEAAAQNAGEYLAGWRKHHAASSTDPDTTAEHLAGEVVSIVEAAARAEVFAEGQERAQRVREAGSAAADAVAVVARWAESGAAEVGEADPTPAGEDDRDGEIVRAFEHVQQRARAAAFADLLDTLRDDG